MSTDSTQRCRTGSGEFDQEFGRLRRFGDDLMLEVSGVDATTPAVEEWCLNGLEEVSVHQVVGDPLVDLTVVVPTWERQDFVLRQLRYWAPSAARLVVVDGSDLPLPCRVREAIDGMERITYRHERRPFHERLVTAGSLVSTKYAVMLGDDEFHFPSGLRTVIHELEEESGLVGCMGQVLSFSPLDAYRRCLFSRVYRTLYEFDVCQTEPVDRLVAAMDPYTMATPYAVLRTAVWCRSWGSVGSYSSGVAAEMQQAMSVHLLGAFRTVATVQWLRSIENEISAISDLEVEQNRMIWFPEWWTKSCFSTERESFVAGISEVVAEEIGMTAKECSRGIVLGAEAFLEGSSEEWEHLDSSVGSARTGSLSVERGVSAVGRRLPDPLGLALRRFRAVVLARMGSQGGDYYGTSKDLPAQLRRDGVKLGPEFIDEVTAVEKLVSEFHELRRQEQAGA